MGATDFYHPAKGKTAKEAFEAARREAQYLHGHGGYTGTIAEKNHFVMIPLPKEAQNNIGAYAYRLLEEGDSRISDKWGPAGCFDLGNGEFLFFGIASS